MQLLGDRVLVIPEPKKEMTDGGIIIPETAKKRAVIGKVFSVGEGFKVKNGDKAGTLIPMSVKVNDRVQYEEEVGMEMIFEGKKLVMLFEDNITAIL